MFQKLHTAARADGAYGAEEALAEERAVSAGAARKRGRGSVQEAAGFESSSRAFYVNCGEPPEADEEPAAGIREVSWESKIRKRSGRCCMKRVAGRSCCWLQWCSGSDKVMMHGDVHMLKPRRWSGSR